MNDKQLRHALQHKVEAAKVAFFNMYPTASPVMIARMHSKITLMAELATEGFDFNPPQPPPVAQPLPPHPEVRKLLLSANAARKAAPAKKKYTYPPRTVPYVVKDKLFRELTQEQAVTRVLADQKELTTKEVALRIAEHGYPFKTKAIVESTTVCLGKMLGSGKLSAKPVHEDRKRMNRWSLAGRLHMRVAKA